MDEGTIALTIMSLLIFLSFLGFLIWGFKSGQFKNIEDAKQGMFRNNEKSAGNPDISPQNNPGTGSEKK